jgi:mRNA-degrading endonuclease toxin of MazEF toxin-antitoxin module
MEPERGDVVRSVDPFKIGEDRQRPWLIVNNESHPFGDQPYIAVAISTKAYSDSLSLESKLWDVGGTPRESFVSPWAIHSPRGEDFVAWQGRLSEAFVDEVIDAVETYLR